MRNYAVKIQKTSLTSYFAKHCEKHNERVLHIAWPFVSDNNYLTGGNVTLNEYGETKKYFPYVWNI